METLAFRPRGRLLQLLGEQLIGNERLAVFELVKNAYDADASTVTVTLHHIDREDAYIVIEDDGEGMDINTIKNVWMEPGSDHRQIQRNEKSRSPKYHRLPLGEKGLGHFAVHRLAEQITLITKKADNPEHIAHINWNTLIQSRYLDNAPVIIKTREAEDFVNKTGTKIILNELKQTWTRGKVRTLYRNMMSMCSPFSSQNSFQALLKVPGFENWLKELLNMENVLARAMWHFTFSFEKGRFDWKYRFIPLAGIKVQGREEYATDAKLLLPKTRKGPVVAMESMTEGIGPVQGEFYVYDRGRSVMNLLTETQFFTDYLNENGGVSIYRDGIRVYNYGEPADDWLGLDSRRVNIPAKRISRNIMLGAVHLSLEDSPELKEKTN
ncbi:MAG: ATP-binding protein, partial [Gammaproteobacteria bacterium]|nr:ATP-binding protein [Gammaproteobacteria bacterium]